MEAADALTADLLGARRELTSQASERYVSQLQRDIARSQAKPVTMILAVLFCAIEDGAPADDVRRFHRNLGALVEARLAQRDGTRPTRDPGVLHPLETELQGEAERAQIRALLERTPAAKAAFVEQMRRYVDVAVELTVAVEHDVHRAAPARIAAA